MAYIVMAYLVTVFLVMAYIVATAQSLTLDSTASPAAAVTVCLYACPRGVRVGRACLYTRAPVAGSSSISISVIAYVIID